MLNPSSQTAKRTVIFYSSFSFAFGFYGFIAGSRCNIFVSFGDFSSPLFCRKNKFANGRRNIFTKSPTNKFQPPTQSPPPVFLSFFARSGDKSSLVEWVLVGGGGVPEWDGAGSPASNDKWSRLEGTIMASAMAVAFTCDVV